MSAAKRTIDTQGLVDRDRLKDAVLALRECGEKGISRTQLQERLGGVSLRTIDRSIQLLEEQGANIQRVREGRNSMLRYILVKGPKWDEHVSPEARLALRLATLSLSQSATGLMDDQLKAIEELVSEHMSEKDRRLFDTLQKSVQMHGGVDDPIEPGNILEPILRAIEGGRELEIEYSAPEKKPESRTVVPHCITLDIFSGGSFLAAWDPKDGRPKHFRLSRIDKAKVSTRHGFISDLATMQRAARYQIGGWISAEEPFEVQLRIKGPHWLEAFREAPPALPEFTATPDAESQTVEVRFKANHLNGAARWILQFGDCVNVQGPKRLRDHIHCQLRGATKQYENTSR